MLHPVFPHTEAGVRLMAEYLQSQILVSGGHQYAHSDILIPVIFLAGAPGAGKTEWIESFPDIEHYVILDTDLYRSLFEGYTGTNASGFHQYASRVMDRMYSFCIKHGYNMIVDGTFSNEQKSRENIAQCRKKGIPFSVVLVIQDPIISYLYTKKREQEKRRNVPTEAFVQKYYQSISVVRNILSIYSEAHLLVAKKDSTGQEFQNRYIDDIEMFDKITQIPYTSDVLLSEIHQIETKISKNTSLEIILGNQLKNNSIDSSNPPR